MLAGNRACKMEASQLDKESRQRLWERHVQSCSWENVSFCAKQTDLFWEVEHVKAELHVSAKEFCEETKLLCWKLRRKEKINTLTCVCSDGFQFVLVHVGEERRRSVIDCHFAPFGYETSSALFITNKQTNKMQCRHVDKDLRTFMKILFVKIRYDFLRYYTILMLLKNIYISEEDTDPNMNDPSLHPNMYQILW